MKPIDTKNVPLIARESPGFPVTLKRRRQPYGLASQSPQAINFFPNDIFPGRETHVHISTPIAGELRYGYMNYANEQAWLGCKNSDPFDKLVIKVNPNYPVYVRKLKIRLNGQIDGEDLVEEHLFSNSDYYQIINSEWDLSDLIYYCRWRKAKMSDNKIIKIGCNEIYKSWSSKYNCKWLYHDHWNKWDPAPLPWCTEWATWLIRKATIFTPPTIFEKDPPVDNLGITDVLSYFDGLGRWINPSNTDYKDLGKLIKPGFYVALRMGENYHSTMFISWERIFDDSKNGINVFWGLGGNQNNNRVAVTRFTLRSEGAANLRWNDMTDDIGFCDTTDIQPTHLLPAGYNL